jgi:peptidoglycan/xylan/chitin deacetylase (PgdA/CDA1 family)
MPMLRERGWPFTVFVSTEAVDNAYRGYLSWDELRELGRNGATFGNHSVSHAHLVRRLDAESEAAWQARISAEISEARSHLNDELGARMIPVFAWPYGEYTTATRTLLADSERFGLGQHSGAAGPDSDFLALPRYPVATGLALTEFALRARSRPLPVKLAERERHIADPGEERPPLRLVLDDVDDVRIDELACYASGQGRMQLEWLNNGTMEFVIRPERALQRGRSKYNCTAPSRNGAGVWYWFGYLWMRQLPDGSWYTE